MRIVSRSEWAAQDPRRAPYRPGFTHEVFLHHSVGYGSGGASYMRRMQDQHRNGNGWNDIAYNFVIDPRTLTVYEGRGWGVAPGAQEGHNTGTLAICVMGDFRAWRPDDFPGLLQTVADLIRLGHDKHNLPLKLTGGHRDAPGQSTSCPGDHLHRVIPDIRVLLSEELPVKIPLESWAKPSFQWAIDKKFYTETTNVDAVRETYEMQRVVVFFHRFFNRVVKPAVGVGGATVAAVIAEIVSRLT